MPMVVGNILLHSMFVLVRMRMIVHAGAVAMLMGMNQYFTGSLAFAADLGLNLADTPAFRAFCFFSCFWLHDNTSWGALYCLTVKESMGSCMYLIRKHAVGSAGQSVMMICSTDKSPKAEAVIDITEKMQEIVQQNNLKNAACALFAVHTICVLPTLIRTRSAKRISLE
jgi:hypothetical protein